jgi:hypothetical protein
MALRRHREFTDFHGGGSVVFEADEHLMES